MTSPKETLEKLSQSVKLAPGLSTEELLSLEAKLPGSMPPEIKDLLFYSAGFELEASHFVRSHRIKVDSGVQVRFEGSGAVEFEFLPYVIDLCGDGLGNFWIVDVSPFGEWGAVLFVAHDPPVVAIQAPDIGTFLSQLLAPEQSAPEQALKFIYEQAVGRIWREDPWLVPVCEVKSSEDAVLARFANQMSDKFWIADLRSKQIGSGFSWGKAGPDTIIKRDGFDLVFAVSQKPSGILSRMFSTR